MECWLIDTFCDADHLGNPAGVALTSDEHIATEELQATARRLALPTTAFARPVGDGSYRIRWFTPKRELNLCGHATIATAGFLYERKIVPHKKRLTFATSFGALHAMYRAPGRVALDLPTLQVSPRDPPAGLEAALGSAIVKCSRSVDDIVVELATEAEVADLKPHFEAMMGFDCRGHVVTAASERAGVDFVSRSFFPALGVDEDQVCVSAHCKLARYWGARLGKTDLCALQLSERGGRLELRLEGDRTFVTGHVRVSHVLQHHNKGEA